MRINQVTIKRYRSIYDTIKCNLHSYTVIVGPNNTGKSNILRAIRLALSPANSRRTLPRSLRRGFESVGYFPEIDYPVGRRKQAKTTIELELEFSDKEKDNENFPQSIKNFATIKFSKEFDCKDGTCITKIADLSNQAEIEKIERYILSNSSFLLIPSNRIFQDPSTSGVLRELTKSIFRNISQSRAAINALSKLRQRAQTEVEKAERIISEELKKFLPDLGNITLQLSEPDLIQALVIESVKLDDGFETSLNAKGDGVQSVFVIGLLQYMAAQKTDMPLILGIEEPEAHLHPDAQSYLSELLHSISKKHQMIITTHSPVMVDRAVHEHNLVVTKNITKNRIEVTNAKDIKIIREVLGVRRGHNLLDALLVAVVEGKTEEVILPKIAEKFFPELYIMIQNGSIRFIETGGTNGAEAMLKYLHRTLQPIVCLFDCDDKGRETYQKILNMHLLNNTDLFILNNRHGSRDTEFEDLFPIEWTLTMLKGKFSIEISAQEWQISRQKSNPKNSTWTVSLAKVLQEHGKMWNSELSDSCKIAWSKIAEDNISDLPMIDTVLKTYLKRIESLYKAEIK